MPSHNNQPDGMDATDPDHMTITPEGTRFKRLFCTKAVVAICVLLVPLAAVGAVATPVKTELPLIERFPPVILPAEDTTPAISKLPPEILPVAVIEPAVRKLPPVTLPVADATVTFKALATTMPDADNVVALTSVADVIPVVTILPPVTFPETERPVNVPKEVTPGCAAVLRVPAKVVAVT